MDRHVALIAVVPLLAAAAATSWLPGLPVAASVSTAAAWAGIAVCVSLSGVGWFSYARGGDRHALLVSTSFLGVGLLEFLAVLATGSVLDVAAQVALASAVWAGARVDTSRPRWWLRREILLPVALAVPAVAALGLIWFPSPLPYTHGVGAGIFAVALAVGRKPVRALGFFLGSELLQAAGGEGSAWSWAGQVYFLLGLGFVYRSAFVSWVRREGTDRQTLLRELHHRTKNTLKMVQGLVVLQASEGAGVPEVKELVRKTEDRIRAISLVHQQVDAGGDLSHLRLQDYLEGLSQGIIRTYRPAKNRISLALEAGELTLTIDAAIPFGLILNELLSNSFQHAFPGGARGAILVCVTTGRPGWLRLEYQDDGVGMGGEVDLQRPESLGLGLIRTMAVQQLKGAVELSGVGGFRCAIDFPEMAREANS